MTKRLPPETLERNGLLTSSTHLRTLEFGSPAAYAALYGADDVSFAWFPTLLGQITSPLIETVGFFLWEGDLDGLSTSAWDNIAYVLADGHFKGLSNLAFHVWGSPDKTRAIVERVKERFHAFDERGILHIDSAPDPAC